MNHNWIIFEKCIPIGGILFFDSCKKMSKNFYLKEWPRRKEILYRMRRLKNSKDFPLLEKKYSSIKKILFKIFSESIKEIRVE